MRLRSLLAVLLLPLAAAVPFPARAAEDAPPAPSAAPELRTASTHPMRYWLSLPHGHSRERKWPVLVVIPDATRDFAGNLASFVAARRDGPFILVAPLVLTCGGPYRGDPPYPYAEAVWREADRSGDFRFDADGIAAAVADVGRLFGGDERYFLTGWEAGGHTVWAMLLLHPERLRGALPVSPNYRGRWVSEKTVSSSPARAGLPVRVLFCDKLEGEHEAGRQGWFAQTKEAMGLAEAHGYRNVSLATVPGRPHGPLAQDVLEVISKLAAPAR